jgi:hypothetical protein
MDDHPVSSKRLAQPQKGDRPRITRINTDLEATSKPMKILPDPCSSDFIRVQLGINLEVVLESVSGQSAPLGSSPPDSFCQGVAA